MNNVKYELPKNVLNNKMNKENVIPPIKPNISNNIQNYERSL